MRKGERMRMGGLTTSGLRVSFYLHLCVCVSVSVSVSISVSCQGTHTIAFESLTHQTKQHFTAEITECGRLIGMHVQAVRLQCWHFRRRI